MSKRCAALILAFSAWSCGSSGSGIGYSNATFIEVSPTGFSGPVCALTGSGLKRYTATLLDISASEASGAKGNEFELPSSPPTPCTVAVGFSEVIPATALEPGHSYVAKLAGYDRSDVRPVYAGSPVLETEDGDYVPPRWVGSCGIAAAPASDAGASADAGAFLRSYGGPVTPLSGRTVRLSGCRLEEVGAADAETQIVLEFGDALAAGGLSCRAEGGQVDTIRAILGEREESVSCGERIVFAGVQPGQHVSVRVEASEASDAGSKLWVTQCSQQASASQTQVADCDPFRPVD